MTLHTQFLYAYLVVVVMYYKLNMLTSSLQVCLVGVHTVSDIFPIFSRSIHQRKVCGLKIVKNTQKKK